MEVGFEHRSPTVGDTIGIGMVDLHDGDRWIDLGQSDAWCWQQGCMLQWRPGSADEIIWNDRDGDRFIAHVMNVKTGAKRTLPMPIYTIAPDGKAAFSIDFPRLCWLRPGYGYATSREIDGSNLAPADGGIWRMDLDTGAHELIVSVADVRGLDAQDSFEGRHHWFNHLLVNPTSTRLEFLHRWARPGHQFLTRMITMNLDGTDPFVLDDGDWTSHMIWRDDAHVLAWARPTGKPNGFWLFRDKVGAVQCVGKEVMAENGHCTYLPGGRFILNDTYPDQARRQHPYLFDIARQQRIPLGHFESPPAYSGEWRCDTHPRCSDDGRLVCIDSPVGDSARGGQGRQLHIIEIAGLVS